MLKEILTSLKNFICDMLDIKTNKVNQNDLNSPISYSSNDSNQINNHFNKKYIITYYKQKNFMTNSELDFYNKLKYFESNYRVIPQLNLASVIQKVNNNKYNSELFRNIDFAIFTKDYSKLLLLIELNDKTHETKSRKRRDAKVHNICRMANVTLITFYTKYPNDEQYVINRISKELRIEEKVIEACNKVNY